MTINTVIFLLGENFIPSLILYLFTLAIYIAWTIISENYFDKKWKQFLADHEKK